MATDPPGISWCPAGPLRAWQNYLFYLFISPNERAALKKHGKTKTDSKISNTEMATIKILTLIHPRGLLQPL